MIQKPPIMEPIQPMPPAWAIWFQALTDAVNSGGSSVQPSVLLPLMDGVAALGNEGKYADGQHVHPTDTSRQAAYTILTTFGSLPNGTGYLYNNGSGVLSYQSPAGAGTVTSVSVVSANGFGGSVATATSTPAITLTTSVNGILKGNGTGVSAAVAGTDYQTPIAAIQKGPTGFTNNENVIVTYDSATRKITLTGTVNAYWQGNQVTALTSGWVSDAHPNTNGPWFLFYDGSNFVWQATSWTFDMLMIAYVQFGTSDKFGIRECHGTMDWQAHEEFHRTNGTYLQSGGDLSGYTIGSTTANERRPAVAATIVHDEDIETTIPLLADNGPYTQLTLTGTGTSTFTTAAAEIVPVSGNQPYWNSYSAPNWGQTLMTNNSYMTVWLVAVPATADAASQAYRYLWVQGQSEGTLASQQALTFGQMNLGQLATLFTEFVPIAKIIIRYQAADWTITSVEKITGTKISQSVSMAGFLTAVTATTPLSGSGTVTDPLVIAASSIVSTYAGAGANGFNYWVGGGGLSSVGSPSTFNGSTNSAFGYQSCYQNTGGYDNTAMGYKALRANQAGYGNTAIGANAMLTSYGDGNTAVGSGAMTNIWLSSNSVAVGNGAMPGSGSSFTGNVAIGNNAFPILTSGSSNSLLGYNSGGGLTTGSNNTILGANVNGLAAGLTNNIILATGDGTIRARFDGTNWTFTPALSASVAWGSITGTLSSQGDLNTALNGKQAAYTILSTLGGLANASGYLTNNGAGALSWSAGTGSTGAVTITLDSQTNMTLASAYINAVGSANTFYQANFQNKSNGAAASTDIVCTTDTGTDTTEYIDMGINGSGYSGTWGAAKDGYLYVDGGASGVGDLVMGTTQPNTYASMQVGSGAVAVVDGFKAVQTSQQHFNTSLQHFTTGLIFAQTATKTHGNSASEVSLANTGRGTLTLPANYLIAGRVLRVRAGGYLTTLASAPGNFTLKLYLGATAILSTTANAMVVNTTARRWEMDCTLVCYTTGAPGTVWGEGRFEASNNSEVTAFQYGMKMSAATNITTTGTLAIDLKATWATASTSNSITCVYLTVEGA